MRIVLQVVTGARVTVEDLTVGEIDGPGLALLVGITHTDTPATAQKLAAKIAGLRVLPGETSCEYSGAPVLAVSQFTLYGDVRRGRRPSWSDAAPAALSEPLFDAFVAALRERGLTVETGRFGAHMAVSQVNDGPITLVVDSDDLQRPRRD